LFGILLKRQGPRPQVDSEECSGARPTLFSSFRLVPFEHKYLILRVSFPTCVDPSVLFDSSRGACDLATNYFRCN